MARTQPMDLVDLIKTQHQEVKRLLDAVESSRNPHDAFDELRRMIAVHETAEEEIIYPDLNSMGDEGRRVADARKSEEAEDIKVLSRLEQMTPGADDFNVLFSEFHAAVLKHAEAEEAEVLPLLRNNHTADVLHEMAETFAAAEDIAPTHAHPGAGTSATANLVVGPVLSIVDRVRDALKRKTQ